MDPGITLGSADGAGGWVVATHARPGRLRWAHQHELCDELDDPQHLLGHGAFPSHLRRYSRDHVFRDRLRHVAAHHRQTSALRTSRLLPTLALVHRNPDRNDPLAHHRSDGTTAPYSYIRLPHPKRCAHGAVSHRVGDWRLCAASFRLAVTGRADSLTIRRARCRRANALCAGCEPPAVRADTTQRFRGLECDRAGADACGLWLPDRTVFLS